MKIQREERDLGFCKVYYKKKLPVNNYYIKHIKKAYKINLKLFNTKLDNFKLFFIYSRRELNKIFGYKTPKWMIAFGWKNKIVIFFPSVIEKLSPWKRSDFYPTLIHEINHLFYQKITGTYKPLWVSEGLASYIQSLYTKRKSRNLIELKKDYKLRRLPELNYCNIKKHYKYSKVSYAQSYLVIKKLIEAYGRNKLLKLIKIYGKNPTRSNFERVFNKTYGFRVKKLEKRFF